MGTDECKEPSLEHPVSNFESTALAHKPVHRPQRCSVVFFLESPDLCSEGRMYGRKSGNQKGFGAQLGNISFQVLRVRRSSGVQANLID